MSFGFEVKEEAEEKEESPELVAVVTVTVLAVVAENGGRKMRCCRRVGELKRIEGKRTDKGCGNRSILFYQREY